MPESAQFAPDASGAVWRVAVGPLREEHVEVVASIYAAREGSGAAAAEAAVRRWLADPDRFVLVAAHDGEVHGYASAQLLDVTAPDGTDAAGWYLSGIVVTPSSRRHGIGTQLTAARLQRLSELTDGVWYFTSSRNLASIALHARFGFVERARGDQIAGVGFEDGTGILFRRAVRARSL